MLSIYRSKSGIYHFLINFSSGLVWWYMKVVYEIFDCFQLAEFDSFCGAHRPAPRPTTHQEQIAMATIGAIARRLQVAQSPVVHAASQSLDSVSVCMP